MGGGWGSEVGGGNLHHIPQLLQVDPSISPEDLLGYVTNGHTYPTEKYLLVGLHTCGDLAPTILRLFSQSQCIVGVVSVGCCYMKLTCQPCELSNVPTSSSCDCHMTTTCAVAGRGSPGKSYGSRWPGDPFQHATTIIVTMAMFF